jgi:hypothetical protein
MRFLGVLLFLFIFSTSTVADVESDMAAGGQALAESHFEQAVEIFSAVVAEHPDNGQATYNLAIAFMSLDRLDEAAREFEAAGELGFQPLGVGYRLARIRARQGDTDAAIESLDEIAAGGFPVPALIENEKDFDSIRTDKRYVAALDVIRGNRYPCQSNGQSRDLDFWVAEWDVTFQGQPAGTSDVRLILGDCVVFENWESASGTSGKSFNFYDAGEDHWRQIWVDDTGGVIEFTGQVREGVMYYTATTRDPSTKAVMMHKLTFTPNADGTVRQFWEQSLDDGESWQVAFDGHYARKSPVASVLHEDRPPD